MTQIWITKAQESVHSAVKASSDITNVLSQYGYARETSAAAITVTEVVTCLEQFQECVRYLNTRRSKGAVININSEDDIQDVVYLMLRPLILDLVSENPSDRIASRFVIKDFLSKDLHLVVEAKFIRDKQHGKDITKELHDDIEMYRNHPYCSSIIFFIYDHDVLIPDVRALKEHVDGIRNYNGKQIQVFCVVKP